MNGKCEWKTAWDNRRRIQFNFTTIAESQRSVGAEKPFLCRTRTSKVNSKNTDSAGISGDGDGDGYGNGNGDGDVDGEQCQNSQNK